MALKRLAFVPFLALEWVVVLWITRSRRVRRFLIEQSPWRYLVMGVFGATAVTVVLGYMRLNRSIVGGDARLDDPVLSMLFIVQHAALLVVVLRFFIRVPIEPPPRTRKPSPRLVLVLLLLWAILGAIATAVSIGPWAVLPPLSRREGLTIAACAALGTLSLGLALLLAIRERRRNATTPPH